jgi:hypothetical protein
METISSLSLSLFSLSKMSKLFLRNRNFPYLYKISILFVKSKEMVKRKRDEIEKEKEGAKGGGEVRKPIKKVKRSGTKEDIEIKGKREREGKETVVEKGKEGKKEEAKPKGNKQKKAVAPPSSNWAAIAKKIGVDPLKSVVNQQREVAEGKAVHEEGVSREKKHLLDVQAKAKVWLASPQPLSGEEDTSLTKHLALDCEMVGVGEEGKESILAEVAIVNSHGACVYHSHVKPTEFVTNWRTRVSGITPRDVLQNGKDFSEVQREVSEIIQGVYFSLFRSLSSSLCLDLFFLLVSKFRRFTSVSLFHSLGRIILGHHLSHDFKVNYSPQIPQRHSQPINLPLNGFCSGAASFTSFQNDERHSEVSPSHAKQSQTAQFEVAHTKCPLFLLSARSLPVSLSFIYSVDSLSFILLTNHSGAHSPILDARASMLLYLAMKKEWERSIEERERRRKTRKSPKEKQKERGKKMESKRNDEDEEETGEEEE